MNKKLQDDKKHQFNVNAAALAVATVVASTMVAFTDVNSLLYSTNVLSLPEHAPFDGTVYPLKKVTNWSKISGEKRDLPYNQLTEADLIDVPYYDSKQLATSTDTLKWGNPVDDVIRNAKITYSTPYMGNYQLDGREFAGSHLAVDIKLAEGTPIYAIANGVVFKSSNQSDGFGVHVVLQHNNVPSFDDPSKKIVLYSSYSHMSENLMNVGDVVTKGQQIGLSGETGTATTPHLHFQIDNDQATFHPFWPFTWQQASSAGLDFFSAVNAGLGQETALATTVNPVVYVQKYMDGNVIAVDTTPSVDAVSYVKENPPEAVASTEVAPEAATEVTEVAPVVTEPVVVAPETTVVEPQPVEVVTVPEVVTEVKQGFPDVEKSNQYYVAITYLTDKKIIKGYDDGTFKPNQPVNRVEALKFILASINAAIESGTLPFKDVKSTAWYSGYLYTAYKRDIVNGNPDGTFRPNSTVNKAEFFKILFNGLSVDIDPVVSEAPYEDVPADAWYAAYIAYAKELKILDPSFATINPSKGMTRGEVADAMYRLLTMEK